MRPRAGFHFRFTVSFQLEGTMTKCAKDIHRHKRQSNTPAGNTPVYSSVTKQYKGPALLGLLDHKVREKVLLQCVTRRYAKGEHIIRATELDNKMYFIDRGRVQITLLSRDGREVNFANRESGDHFGELSLIDGKPRLATVTALAETHMIIMPPRVFRRMLDRHPAVAFVLMAQLSAMVRRLCRRISEYSTTDVSHRIRAELLRLAGGHLDLDGVVRIPHMPTQAQFAGRVSCHREAVSRELRSLEKEGIVVKKRRRLIIPNIALLQRKQEEDEDGK